MWKKYGINSLVIISLLTIFLVRDFGLTDTNFSVIGNKEGRKLLLLLWGAFVGNFFFLYMDMLMRVVNCMDCVTRVFLLASLFFLVIGVAIPYLPEQFPVLAKYHVGCSFLAPVCFGIAQTRFLYVLQKKTGELWKSQWCIQLSISIISLWMLFLWEMVTSLLEIFLTFGMCLYLFSLYNKLEKIPHKE